MRIALYNLHFATLGGGERRTALLAAHLAQAHELAIFSASPLDTDSIRDLFGIDLARLNNVVLPATSESHHAGIIAEWKPDPALSDEQQLNEIFLSSLARYPRPPERERLANELKARDRKQVFQDLLWAVLNSKEFMFNH